LQRAERGTSDAKGNALQAEKPNKTPEGGRFFLKTAVLLTIA